MQGGNNKKNKKNKKMLDRTTAWSYNKSVERKATKTTKTIERGTNYDELQDFR